MFYLQQNNKNEVQKGVFSWKIRLKIDENAAVRFASFDALWPIYDIDKAWIVSDVLSAFYM